MVEKGGTTASDPVARFKEQMIDARRSQILEAAGELFAVRGFHGTTIRQIAKAAGVSEGTIYNYFDNKFDLLIGLMSRLVEVDHLPAEMSASLGGDVRDFFVAAFRHRLTRIEQGEGLLQALLPQVFINPDLRQQFYREYVRPLAALLEQYVQTQVDLGQIQPVDVPLTVRALQGMFVGLLILRILGDEALHTQWDQVPELLATMIFDGLNAGDGR